MLTLQRAQHWHRGAYLILSRGSADASDGSDSLVAVNLSRPVRLSAHADRDVVAQSHALHLALGAGAPPPSLLLGGPCHQVQPLCLLEICDAESLPVRGDVLRVPLQPLQPPGARCMLVSPRPTALTTLAQACWWRPRRWRRRRKGSFAL
jgi:hypothetical protein